MITAKRAMGVGTFVALVIILIIAIAIIIPGRKLLLGTHETFSALGPGLCTDVDQKRDVEDYKVKINLYAQREGENGISYYDPQAAIEQYRIYLACKDDENSMIKTEDVEKFEPEIKNDVKAALIHIAEDLCKEHSESVSKEEQKSIENAYKDNQEIYYAIFPNEDFTRLYGCEIA